MNDKPSVERTILDIQIAVKDGEPNITDEELRLCIVAQCSIEYFYQKALLDLIEIIREERPALFMKIKAEFAWNTYESMFEAAKKTPKQWLSPADIPGTPANKERMEWAKKVFKVATGEDL